MPQILFSPRLVANGASYVRIFVLGTDFGRFTISSFLVVAETFILAKNRSDYNRLRRDQGGSNPPDAPDSQIWVPRPGGAKTAQIQGNKNLYPPPMVIYF